VVLMLPAAYIQGLKRSRSSFGWELSIPYSGRDQVALSSTAFHVSAGEAGWWLLSSLPI
jgi:hypothetical protein